MKLSSLACSIIFTILLAGLVTPTVRAQTVFVTVQQPHVSARNQILDFYAGGTNEGGYSVRLSPQGGTLTTNGYTLMTLMPWGYVTAQWATGKVYIIFLVNVTQTNFRIGFLYLTNSTDTAFMLRWYDYNQAGTNLYTFQGVQHIRNRTVTTASVNMPKVQIPPPSTVIPSEISALGPQLYLTSTGGKLLNGTRSIKIYPLLNQIYAKSTDYNEVWSLLADDLGNYYFAILYMRNNDPSHVIIEHQLRLNDYRTLDGKTVDAKWMKGVLGNQVTVRTGISNLTVKVDGFPFQTNTNGIVSTGVPDGVASVEVPNIIPESPNSRLKFFTWDKYNLSNPLRLLLNSSLDVTAKYSHEYHLTVDTAYGSTQGSGWYVQGRNVTFTVQNQIDYDNRTKRIFKQWIGDSNSTRSEASVVINSPKEVKASWTTQYAVTITALGLPPNASTVAFIDDSKLTISGSIPSTVWIDANKQVPVTVQTTQIQGAANSYLYSGLRVDNQTLTGKLDVKKPLNLFIVYTGTPKLNINPSSSRSVTPRISLSEPAYFS
jgi:hypothetical protein